MSRKKLLSSVMLILTILLGTLALDNLIPLLSGVPMPTLPDLAQTCVTTFLALFIQVMPFLLFGSIVSGLIEVFITPDDLANVIPRASFPATLVGALLGLIFPVGACGVVPVVRRLYQKGLPVSTGITFLLSAGAINPVVIASTYVAFGLNTVFWARLGFSLLIAMSVGLVFSVQASLLHILRPEVLAPVMGGSQDPMPVAGAQVESFPDRLQRSLVYAANEFFDLGRYLVVGLLIASALQTLVPQQWLLEFGSRPAESVFALTSMTYVLSAGSSVDAFVALPYASTFTPGAIVAFLVLGPMASIKSTLMFLGVFRRRIVFYLFLLPLLATLAISLALNLRLGW